MKVLLRILFFNLLILLVASCGQNLCVMGFGQCDAPIRPVTTTSTSTTTTTTTTTTLPL